MRLWSLHPKYLDPKGLVALWREGLLAQAVLAGQTRGYKNHPQLVRFLQTPAPLKHMAAYLQQVYVEAITRGYHFDEKKISQTGSVEPMFVTQGQLEYEWLHLNNKLRTRSLTWLAQIEPVKQPEPHPSFLVVTGGIAEWEVVITQAGVPAKVPARKSQ